MTLPVAIALWQRLDASGHDGCRLLRLAGGWQLSGSAVFDQEGQPCVLAYTVICDSKWRAQSAIVEGWTAFEDVKIEIIGTGAGDWLLNQVAQPGPAGCVDLDLGFTPATNLVAVRRLDLAIGEEAPDPAAYLSFPRLELVHLEQTYRRTGEATFAYSAPAFGYSRVLDVSPVGFVTHYPGLWRGEVISVGRGSASADTAE